MYAIGQYFRRKRAIRQRELEIRSALREKSTVRVLLLPAALRRFAKEKGYVSYYCCTLYNTSLLPS